LTGVKVESKNNQGTGSRDVLKKVNNLKTNRYRKKETSMNDRGAFLCDAAESSFLI
jgi:hypothetical protein